MTEICDNITVEPSLLHLRREVNQMSGSSAITNNGARLDTVASGFWVSYFDHFSDVTIFSAHACLNRQQSITAIYRKHECLKQCAIEQRVCEVEWASVTPLVTVVMSLKEVWERLPHSVSID